MENSFISYIEHFVNLSDQQKQILGESIELRTFEKNEYILRETEVCSELLFVREGFVRVFVTRDIEEHITFLTGPQQFVSALSSLISRNKSLENIQALTKVEAFSVSVEKLKELRESDPDFETINRTILEHMYVQKSEHLAQLLKFDSDKRYRLFEEHEPEILQNVPLHYIASYLGMKPETLSRIRKKRIWSEIINLTLRPQIIGGFFVFNDVNLATWNF